jgi:hypothetical protein
MRMAVVEAVRDRAVEEGEVARVEEVEAEEGVRRRSISAAGNMTVYSYGETM